MRGERSRTFSEEVTRETGHASVRLAFVQATGFDRKANRRLRNNAVRHERDPQSAWQHVCFAGRYHKALRSATFGRSEEHKSELQSRLLLVRRLLLE